MREMHRIELSGEIWSRFLIQECEKKSEREGGKAQENNVGKARTWEQRKILQYCGTHAIKNK